MTIKRLVQKHLTLTYLGHLHISIMIGKCQHRFLEGSQCCHHNPQSQLIPLPLPHLDLTWPHRCRRNPMMRTPQSRGASMPLEQSSSMLDHVRIMLFASRVVASSLRWRIAQIVERNSAATIGLSSGFIETNPIKGLKTVFLMRRLIHGLRTKLKQLLSLHYLKRSRIDSINRTKILRGLA